VLRIGRSVEAGIAREAERPDGEPAGEDEIAAKMLVPVFWKNSDRRRRRRPGAIWRQGWSGEQPCRAEEARHRHGAGCLVREIEGAQSEIDPPPKLSELLPSRTSDAVPPTEPETLSLPLPGSIVTGLPLVSRIVDP